jgi:hypothetical protein
MINPNQTIQQILSHIIRQHPNVANLIFDDLISSALSSEIDISDYRKAYQRLSTKVLNKIDIRHTEPSLICSPDESVPNAILIDLITKAINLAFSENVTVSNPELPDSIFYNVFPGEHYRILKAICKIMSPSVVVEVGTYTGMGAVAFLQGGYSTQVVTYDVLPWFNFRSHLSENDFKTGRLTQHIGDLSNEEYFESQIDVLSSAELIFVDAPKNGIFEYKFLPLLRALPVGKTKILVLDDIRFVNMIDLWRSIKSPKLDITSFGHWSGTGLVDMTNGLEIESLVGGGVT